jgi:hypothetical protein
MALTVTTSPFTYTNVKYFPIGFVWERNIIVTSTTALAGRDILYEPQQFLPDPLLPDPSTAGCPTCCRWVFPSYATTGGVYVPMTLIPDTFAEKWKNVKVWIHGVSGSEFRLRIETVQTMDMGGVFKPNSINLSSYDRFMKNHRLNPLIFDNGYPAIYNEDFRYWRHKIQTTADCEDTPSVETVFMSDELGGHWWNFDTLFYDYALQLKVGGVPVTKFSNTADTTVEIYFKLLAPLAGIWYTGVGIFRLDSIDNVSPFYTDIDLNYGEFNPPNFDNATVQATIPTTAFKNSVAPVNVSGNLWKIEFDVDKDHIQPGAEYRLYTVLGPASETDGSESHLFRPIYGGDEPPPVTGDVDWLVKTYHPGDPVGTTNCVVGVAPGERIYIRNRMNKASWEAASGLAFDPNFYGVIVHKAASAPISGYPVVSLEIIPDTETDDPDYTVEVEFRIPPSWRGNIRYVIFEWIFSTGTVYAPVQIAVNDYDPVNILAEWFDAETDLPIGEICEGSDKVIYALVDHSYPGIDQYYPLGVLKLNGLDDVVAEYEGFASTNLTTLEEAPFTDVYREIIDITKSRFYIDTKDLDTGKYCLLAILKLAGVGGGDPCASYDVDLVVTNMGSSGGGSDVIRIDWNLPIVPPNFNGLYLVVGAGSGSQNFGPLAATGTMDILVNPLFGPCHFLTIHAATWYNECVIYDTQGIGPLCYGETGNLTITMAP